MREVRLTDHKYANCKVRLYPNRDIELISYTTVVLDIKYTKDNIYKITCTGLYSTTTRRHISWFLDEYFPMLNYYDIKSIYEDNTTMVAYRG